MTNIILNKRVPNIVYYNDDHSMSPVCTSELSEINGANWTLPASWQELTREIERGEDKIVFHIDMINKSGEGITEFIRSLKTIVKFMPGHKPLKILVLITPTTTQQQINELKDSGILGIGYDVTYYSFEQAAVATKALIAGEPYWPEHIINQLPIAEKKPISIYFRKDAKEYARQVFSQFTTLEMVKVAAWEPRICSNWDELGALLEQQPHQLIFHVGVITDEITIPEVVSMLETLIRMSANKKVPIALAIEDSTPLNVVKEFQKCGIHGIVPSATSFGFVETTKGINALFNRIPYWPKHILEQLPGFIKKPTTKSTAINLTTRQGQIFQLITERGASNKVIARALGITESAVKVHITKIFKKYGVRNRTQLAVFSNAD